jgi:UDP-N-acetylglucosamine:LPS N-acetylglucosamine transferase
LLKHCDISLTRAGTTSLAEQKLYNLKIIMVPIPWTHDQYDNAKYYVKHYDDILLDSKDPDYKNNMLKIFDDYKNFKKSEQNVDILSVISKAKDVIVNELIS